MSLLKVTRQEIVFISHGSAFYIRGAETEKVLSPYRLRDGGTYKSLFVDKRNTRVARCSTWRYVTVAYFYHGDIMFRSIVA